MRTKIQLNFCPMVNGKDITTLLNRKPFSTGGLNFPSAFLKGEKKNPPCFPRSTFFCSRGRTNKTGPVHFMLALEASLLY